MIIKDIRIFLLRLPWAGQPLGGKATGPREVVAVEIETASGIVGMGHLMLLRGGLTEMRKIAALADTWGLTISPHLAHEVSVHVMASIPNGLIIEYLDFLDDAWMEPIKPQGPMVRVPERPGHGLVFKEEVLRDYAVKM